MVGLCLTVLGRVHVSLRDCWLVDFLTFCHGFSSKDDTPAATPAKRIPCLHLDALVQQICSFGPPLGRAVQDKSASVTTYFSLLVPYRGGW